MLICLCFARALLQSESFCCVQLFLYFDTQPSGAVDRRYSAKGMRRATSRSSQRLREQRQREILVIDDEEGSNEILIFDTHSGGKAVAKTKSSDSHLESFYVGEDHSTSLQGERPKSQRGAKEGSVREDGTGGVGRTWDAAMGRELPTPPHVGSTGARRGRAVVGAHGTKNVVKEAPAGGGGHSALEALQQQTAPIGIGRSEQHFIQQELNKPIGWQSILDEGNCLRAATAPPTDVGEPRRRDIPSWLAVDDAGRMPVSRVGLALVEGVGLHDFDVLLKRRAQSPASALQSKANEGKGVWDKGSSISAFVRKKSAFSQSVLRPRSKRQDDGDSSNNTSSLRTWSCSHTHIDDLKFDQQVIAKPV